MTFADRYRLQLSIATAGANSRIEAAMVAGTSIHFVLPAFPAKSPNLKKVLGIFPDQAERLALNFLKSLCDEIAQLYPPGARLTICSDGRVFSDVVGLYDDDVSIYQSEILQLVDKVSEGSIDVFSLDHHFKSAVDFQSMRQELLREYGESLDTIRQAIKTSSRENILFNGIERFLFEDFLGVRPDLSRTKVRKLAHEHAYSTIQRSHAWSALVERYFPNAVRLSIHPQPCHHTKLGIQLIDSEDTWITPWHGVAVFTNGDFKLMKRYEAEQLGASLQYENGRPSYFIIS